VFTREQGVGEGIAGWVAHHLEPLILQPGTESKYPGLELRKTEITAAIIVPIVLRDELVGVLNISSRRVDARYSDEDAQALGVFAENAGACIRHSERAEWMRQLIERQSADRAPTEPVRDGQPS